MSTSRFIDLKARRAFRCAVAISFLFGIGMLGACQTQEQRIVHHEDNLAAAGFIVRPANTPERQAMLHRLPANRFVQRVKGDVVHYVYADPLVCGCLYVGSQQAFNQYKRDQLQRRLANEEQMAAQSYEDVTWNWNAWGPWDEGYGFMYGPGFGW